MNTLEFKPINTESNCMKQIRCKLDILSSLLKKIKLQKAFWIGEIIIKQLEHLKVCIKA